MLLGVALSPAKLGPLLLCGAAVCCPSTALVGPEPTHLALLVAA
jgi:hypothetical protein